MRRFRCHACATILFVALSAWAQTFDVSTHTIDGGGGTSVGGVFEVRGTVGQPDAGLVLTGDGYSAVGGFWVGGGQSPGEPINIISTHSCLLHGEGGLNETDLCIDLLAQANPVEPRLGGPDTLRFGFSSDIDSDTVSPENIQVDCVGDPAGAFSASLDAANEITLAFDEPIHTPASCDNEITICGNCCTIGFDGLRSTGGDPVSATGKVIILAGDVDFNGGVTGGDASIIKPNFGRIAGIDLVGPQFDFDRNGGVTGGDYALIKPLFGHLAPACP